MTREVWVRGVGMHPFGRFEHLDVTALGQHAVRKAMAEAHIGAADFEAALCGTVYSGVAAGHRVLSALACTGKPIVNVEAGCASGGAALSLAFSQIASGQYDTVLVSYVRVSSPPGANKPDSLRRRPTLPCVPGDSCRNEASPARTSLAFRRRTTETESTIHTPCIASP
jgi:acetyl-CoA acetyltransferase